MKYFILARPLYFINYDRRYSGCLYLACQISGDASCSNVEQSSEFRKPCRFLHFEHIATSHTCS